MRIIKRTFIVFLCTLLALCGCGGSNNSNSNRGKENTGSEKAAPNKNVAHYTATRYMDLVEAFADESGKNVYIELGSNIISTEEPIMSRKGITYTINSKEGYGLVDIGFHGEGTVVINTWMDGREYGGLYAGGAANIIVNRDIICRNAGAIYANQNARITVNGNVRGGGDYELDCHDTEGFYGVCAVENAFIEINGDVSGGLGHNSECNEWMGGAGIIAVDDATVSVTGNVRGGDMHAEDDYYSYGGWGIDMGGNAKVTVGGNVTGGTNYGTGEYCLSGDGVIIDLEKGDCTLTVKGNVSGGSVPYGAQKAQSFCLWVADDYTEQRITVGSYEDIMIEGIDEKIVDRHDCIVVTG